MIISSSCSNEVRILPPSDFDYSNALDINTPEGLAKTSSELYADLVNQSIRFEDALDRLLEISTSATAENLLNNQYEFQKQINETILINKHLEDEISGFKYARTVYPSEQTAYIERIQVQKSGKEYYFRQDYKLENGRWKIVGDNVINDFKLLPKWSIQRLWL